MKTSKLYDLVLQMLVNTPELRGSDKKLMWQVWQNLGYLDFEGRFGYILTAARLFNEHCPTPESITRCRRKIQELHPELQADNRTRKARADKAEQKGTHIYREKAKAALPRCPSCYAGYMVHKKDYDYTTGVAVVVREYDKCNRCGWRTNDSN